MATNRLIIIIIALSFSTIIYAQDVTIENYNAFKYKLDYDIPESPAFSILDANPTTVTRGSAAQELIVNFANNFISGDKVNSGVAVDFNPYFVFGGRLKSINDYRENNIKRILANMQFSFATTTIEDFPDDIMISAGLRITLFDSKDLLQHKELGKDIDKALEPKDGDLQFNKDSDEIVDNPALLVAYKKTKEAIKNKKGGALSIGFATAGRFINSDFKLDSLKGYRNQVWLSSQYSFGKGLNLLGLVMYRNNIIQGLENINELKIGVGLKYLASNVNIGGEIVYSSESSNQDIGVNIETLIMKRLILYTSIGNRSEASSSDNKIRVMSGIKWNLSETKK